MDYDSVYISNFLCFKASSIEDVNTILALYHDATKGKFVQPDQLFHMCICYTYEGTRVIEYYNYITQSVLMDILNDDSVQLRSLTGKCDYIMVEIIPVKYKHVPEINT